jgi:gliding motility-associated-like protein
VKTLFCIKILILGLLPSAFAQYAWFREFSGNGYVFGGNLSITKDDAIYTVGKFTNDVSVLDNSFSGTGSFIVKLTKNGDLIWVHRVANSTNDIVNQVRSDDAGNIYIMGTCNQNVIIGGQTIPGAQNTSYVAKLNGEGSLQWFQIIPVQNIFKIDVNKRGDLVLIGRLFGEITVGGRSLSCSQCSFGASLTTAGTFLWAKTFGDKSFPISATIDEDGNTFFNGNFWADFSLDGKNAVATGLYSLFYAKMNDQGICSWLTSVKQIEPSGFTNPASRVTQFGAMKAYDNGTLMVGGHYFKSIEFENHVLQGDVSNEYANNFYLAKFDSNGKVNWAVSRVGNSSGNSIDNVVIKNNTVFVNGQDGTHVFIYEYSLAGNLIRETVLTSFNGDWAGGFGIDSENSQYVSGRKNTSLNTAATAFVLKLGTPPMLPSPADAINVALANCASEDIEVTTSEISLADIYQWEILYHNKLLIIETTGPVLLFKPETYGIDGNCQIRVRGKNKNGTGSFSSYQTIYIDFPLDELQIERQCYNIVAQNSDSFKWYFNDEPASYPDGQIEISPQESGEYFIKQENACGQKESNILNYIKADVPFVPNIITPDGDAFNEYFDLSSLVGNTAVSIYNRWGNEVFQSKAYTKEWNGDNLPSGVYFYQIKNSCLNTDLKGSVTIAR